MIVIIIWLKLNIDNGYRQLGNIKYNVENLKEGTNAKEYRNKVEELLQVLPNTEDQHVEAAWEDIKQAICKAADNALY